MQDNQVLNYLEKRYHENKLPHAFLLETNNIDKCLNMVKEFLKIINYTDNEEENSKLSKLIDNEEIPSLKIIKQENNMIKIEEVNDLKESFMTMPVFTKYNMYIFTNAECLNNKSANAMLKFLEEPEENIIGFFITNNKENMIDTIKSRCEILLDYYKEDKVNIPSTWIKIAINYLKEINMNEDMALLYNKDVLNKIINNERENLLHLFKSLMYIYNEILESFIKNIELPEDLKELSFLLDKDYNTLLKETKYLSNILDILNYNVNINMLLDRYILERRD